MHGQGQSSNPFYRIAAPIGPSGNASIYLNLSRGLVLGAYLAVTCLISRFESNAIVSASPFLEAGLGWVRVKPCPATQAKRYPRHCFSLEPCVPDSILEKVAAGNPQAVEQCLERYGGLVWSLARRLSPTTSDAEDAVQEIFLDLWKHSSRFDARKEPSEAVFIAMIARRRLIDRHRRHARQARTVPMDATPSMPAATPSNELEVLEEAGRVRGLLERLTSEEREVLELIFFQGLSQAAISELLNMPLGTVKTHSRRGLIRLRQLAADSSTDVMDFERKGER